MLPVPNGSGIGADGEQISVINDMTAIPTFMAQSLSQAKGTWGHAGAQAVKGAAYGAANLVSGQKKE